MDSSLVNWREHRISPKNVLVGISVATLTALGVVTAVMNPSQAAYESYATKQVISLLDGNICKEAPKAFDLQRECKAQLVSKRSQIREFIASNTQQQNFVFFSIYTTDVYVSSFLPSYRVETIGAFQQFHIFDTSQN